MFAALAPVVQERVAVLGEVPAMVDFMFLDAPAIDDEAWAKAVADDDLAVTILSAAIDAYEGLAGDWTHDALHAATLAVGEGVGRKLGKAQAPIRVAVTGRRVGPAAVRGARGARARADAGPAAGGRRPGPGRPGTS